MQGLGNIHSLSNTLTTLLLPDADAAVAIVILAIVFFIAFFFKG
jgi:hypothetical protein